MPRTSSLVAEMNLILETSLTNKIEMANDFYYLGSMPS